MRNIVTILAALGLVFQLASCTSKDSKDVKSETADIETLDGLGDPAAANEPAPAESLENAAAPAVGGDLAADPFADGTANVAEPAALTPEPTLEAPVAAEPAPATPAGEMAAADPMSAASSEPPPSLPETNTPVAASAATDAVAPAPVAAPVAKAELKKIDSTPRMVKDVPLNTVYIARNGDTLSEISNKIFGSNKTKELKKYNSFLKSRDVKVGDKVYYNSPSRPTDITTVLNYYEDTGVAPQIYTADKDGKLKNVSKELLGSKENWKEIWATNAIESKTDIPAGTQLKYWPTEVAASSTVASAVAGPATEEPIAVPEKKSKKGKKKKDGADAAAAATVADSGMPAAPDMNMPPPPAPPEPTVAKNDLPPPPASEMAPPPPPPPVENAPPPPPPPVAKEKKAKGEEVVEASADDMMGNYEILGAGFLAIGIVVFLIIRNRKKKAAQDQFINETQVGS